MPRRLAAILAAVFVGRSRPATPDEAAALLARIRREVVDPVLTEHRGRLLGTDDGFLATFDGPLRAVQCAIAIQQGMLARNGLVPSGERLDLRIGVDLGEVVIGSDSVVGDAVTAAAGLKSLASPGSVAISGAVHEQIKNKLVCGYQPLGQKRLKDVADPVGVYRVLPDPSTIQRAKRAELRRALLQGGAAMAVLALLGFGIAAVLTRQQPETAAATRLEESTAGAQAERTQAAAAPLPAAAPDPAPWVDPPAQSRKGRQPSRKGAATGTPQPLASLPDDELAPPSQPPEAAVPERAAPGPQASLVAPAARVERSAAGARSGERDCARCPEVVALPGGAFAMGSDDYPTEKPIRQVQVKPFAIGRYPVTVGEWRQCVAAKACTYEPTGEDGYPVSNLSWDDAQQYLAWLSSVTRKTYRLPTEAEWEYAARAGTRTRYWWGAEVQPKAADCKGCGGAPGARAPMPVGSFAPNPFGLHDMGGGVEQWVADCWSWDYNGAPTNGSARERPNCRERVLRGGSWLRDPTSIRPANRNFYDPSVRYPSHGLRVVRSP